MLTVCFVTSNPEKLKDFEEVQRRLKDLSMSGEKYDDLPEVLGSSYTDLVEKKALAAFEHFRRPVVVDHASLQIRRLNNLPGSASKPFWAALGTQRAASPPTLSPGSLCSLIYSHIYMLSVCTYLLV